MAKKRPTKKRKVDPNLERARLAAKVRYGPVRAELASLDEQALSDLTTGVGIQRGVAQGIRAAAERVGPRLHEAYTGATGTVRESEGRFREDLGGVGGAADPYRGAAARETAATIGRLSEADVAAQSETGARVVGAEQGRAAGIRSLSSEFVKNRAKIAQKRLAIGEEEGAFIASTFGDLEAAELKAQQQAADAAAQRALTRRGQDLTAETSRRGQDITAETADENRDAGPAGKPVPANQRFGMTPDQRRAFPVTTRQVVGLIRNNPSMRAYASGLKGKSAWAAVRADLLEGSNPSKKAYPRAVVDGAMDFAIYGYLSPRNKAYWKKHGIPGWNVRLPRSQTIYGNRIGGRA